MRLEFGSEAAPSGALLRFVTKEDAAEKTATSDKEFSGAPGSVHVAREDGRRVAWAGLGPATKVTGAIVRRAAGAGARKLVTLGESVVSVDSREAVPFAAEIAEGAAMGAYTFDRYKTKDRREGDLETLHLVGVEGQAQEAAHQGLAIAESVNRVRDIGNTPPNLLTPAALADEARVVAEKAGATSIRIWDAAHLRHDGFGGLLAVGGGSKNSPRFILIERMVNKDFPTVAIVGKAITFDSGGISIKPRAAMDEMKYDKMGGVAALGIVQAVAGLDLPINIVAAVCSAENLVGEGAYRPSDVVTTYGGGTIEVLDTDAEGRIVLADGLGYVRKHIQTDLIIDLATLTGACCVALGLHRSGVFTEDAELAKTLFESGEETGDRVWWLPLGEDYSKGLKSRIADIRNIAGNRWGGASIAGEFLKHFVGDARWAHLDIAGPGLLLDDLPEMEPGASGAGVRVVVEALRRLYPRQG